MFWFRLWQWYTIFVTVADQNNTQKRSSRLPALWRNRIDTWIHFVVKISDILHVYPVNLQLFLIHHNTPKKKCDATAAASALLISPLQAGRSFNWIVSDDCRLSSSRYRLFNVQILPLIVIFVNYYFSGNGLYICLGRRLKATCHSSLSISTQKLRLPPLQTIKSTRSTHNPCVFLILNSLQTANISIHTLAKASKS